MFPHRSRSSNRHTTDADGNAWRPIRVLMEGFVHARPLPGDGAVAGGLKGKTILMLLVKKIMRLTGPILTKMDRMNFSLIAAGIGLFAMLALFPALATIVMLWSLLASPDDAYTLLAMGAGLMPPDVLTLMSEQIKRVIAVGEGQEFGWALVLTLFVSIYLARFGDYNKIYGSIGAAVALLIWFYLSAYVVLLGGTLNAELARRGLLGTHQRAARPGATDDAHLPRDPAQPTTPAST